MRKALFAVVMVAASFAGGAAANGPGLAWARALIQAQTQGPVRPRLAPLPPRSADDRPATRDDAATPTTDVPAAPAPPLVLAAPILDTPSPSRDKVPPSSPPASSPEPAPPEPLDPKVLGLDPAPANPPSPDPPTDAPVVVPAPPTPAPTPTPTPPAKADPATANAGGAQAPGDWSGLRRRMKDLGVSRYWVEGEPGGPSRFRCLIPSAAGRAVGQHFEAEGDDDLGAAEAALRRIALWRATEPQP